MINQWITDKYFQWFAEKYLPTFRPEIISRYRSPEKNKEVGGLPDSAHQYGLALDFVLVHPDTGQYLPAAQLEKICHEFVIPNWEGFALYEKPKTGTTGHIHVNLDRDLTKYTWIAGAGLAAIAAAWGIQKIKKIKKP